MNPEEITIRPGIEKDLPQIVDIYNHYVKHTHITFDVDLIKVSDRISWFDDFSASDRHHLVVAQEGERLLGYAHSRAFRPKAAYQTSVEVTVYTAPGNRVIGIGSQLYEFLFKTLENKDVHRAYGGIALPNEASIALHLKFGFEPLHIFNEVGRKFNRYFDVQWFEKRL